MSVLIIGGPEEAHAAFIYDKVQARGGHPVYFDTRRFPTEMRLQLTPDEALGVLQDGNASPLPLREIQAVYWRYHMGVQLPDLPEATDFMRDMAYREIDSTLGSLFRMLPCRWVNSPEAIAMHIHKAYQLQVLQRAGLRIPQTLVTNDPQAVRDFYERLNHRMIYKPVRGGAHTLQAQPEDLSPARLAELAKAPVQFQELIEGVDVRVYWVNGECFAGEIRSKTLDFREDPDAEIVPVALPDAVQADCAKLADLLGLLFSGIDIRRTPAGEYVFLEGNPCPMFLHFERQAGYPISDRLVDLLLSP